MTPICIKCNKAKKDMRAYVPMQVIRGNRCVTGKPGFMCTDCLNKKGDKS